MIFGIDDKITQFNKSDDGMRLFSKTYRTLFMDNPAERILPLKNEEVVIKFFGHSLSAADYSYFQSIFDYYGIYDNENTTLEFYYMPLRSDSKGKITDSVYSLINQYGLTLENKEQGKNLIHKLILEKRIKIIKIEDF